MRPIHRSLAVASIAARVAHAGGARGGGGGSSAKATEKPVAKAAAKTADVPPPPGSKFAKVTIGMSDAVVRTAIGEPTSSKDYMSGKAWIPWATEGSRSEWIYKGQGRVVFGRNRYSGTLKVIRILYNPAEAGS